LKNKFVYESGIDRLKFNYLGGLNEVWIFLQYN
jgi:hypothetical protein